MERPHHVLAAWLALGAVSGLWVAEPKAGESPADHLPPHISRVTWFGERADWSHDGKRILFLSKTFGDAMELDLETKVIRNRTAHYAHGGLYKSYWGGVLTLPRAFADRYTGGKTLALGYGGYYSICGSASRGPALGAIPDPIAGQSSVPVTALLYHAHDAPAPRDGDYFNANCGFWSDQPAGPEEGVWTYDDWCRAGAFVETKAGQAYMAFVRLGTGRLGYDYGTITSAGTADYWYCYDPEDLGAAAGGQKTPWQIVPSSMTRVHYPLGRTVTGACFDSRTGRLYLCVSWAYPDGLESFPVIHVHEAS